MIVNIKYVYFLQGNKAILNAVKQLASSKKGKGHMSEGQQQSRKKSKMEVRDPNAPKKPVNAYVMFFQHKRHSVQADYFKVNWFSSAVAEAVNLISARKYMMGLLPVFI